MLILDFFLSHYYSGLMKTKCVTYLDADGNRTDEEHAVEAHIREEYEGGFSETIKVLALPEELEELSRIKGD